MWTVPHRPWPALGPVDHPKWFVRVTAHCVLEPLALELEEGRSAFADVVLSVDKFISKDELSGLADSDLLQQLHFATNGLIGYRLSKPTNLLPSDTTHAWHGISGLLLSREQFLQWFQLRQPEKDMFSLAGAARYLGLKEHVLYWLRDQRLLYDWHQAKSTRMQSVSKAALERFKQRYV